MNGFERMYWVGIREGAVSIEEKTRQNVSSGLAKKYSWEHSNDGVKYKDSDRGVEIIDFLGHGIRVKANTKEDVDRVAEEIGLTSD